MKIPDAPFEKSTFFLTMYPSAEILTAFFIGVAIAFSFSSNASASIVSYGLTVSPTGVVPGSTGVVPGSTGVVPGSTGVVPGSTGVVPGSTGVVPCPPIACHLSIVTAASVATKYTVWVPVTDDAIFAAYCLISSLDLIGIDANAFPFISSI